MESMLEIDTLDGETAAAARAFESFPRIVEARYFAGGGLDLLMMRLDDGRRLLVPKEELSELAGASAEDAEDLFIGPQGRSVWWPRLDDGLYLPDFLETRWHGVERGLAA